MAFQNAGSASSPNFNHLFPNGSFADKQTCTLRHRAGSFNGLEYGEMHWYHDLAYFFGGAFLVNAIPHFVTGVTGQPFQSPFASPPGEGLSPAWVNVLWGSLNFAIAYLLLARVGNFEFRRWRHVLAAAAGGVAIALMLAYSFGRFHGGE